MIPAIIILSLLLTLASLANIINYKKRQEVEHLLASIKLEVDNIEWDLVNRPTYNHRTDGEILEKIRMVDGILLEHINKLNKTEPEKDEDMKRFKDL